MTKKDQSKEEVKIVKDSKSTDKRPSPTELVTKSQKSSSSTRKKPSP